MYKEIPIDKLEDYNTEDFYFMTMEDGQKHTSRLNLYKQAFYKSDWKTPKTVLVKVASNDF